MAIQALTGIGGKSMASLFSWKGAGVAGALAAVTAVASPLITSGWLNTPPKAYELTNVKEDVTRLEKRLDGMDKRLGDVDRRIDILAQNVAGYAAAQSQTTAAIDRLSRQVDATNSKVDALTMNMLRKASPSEHPPRRSSPSSLLKPSLHASPMPQRK
jgi:septal ring factor EnvC (AmiA/AmiB activator)